MLAHEIVVQRSAGQWLLTRFYASIAKFGKSGKPRETGTRSLGHRIRCAHQENGSALF